MHYVHKCVRSFILLDFSDRAERRGEERSSIERGMFSPAIRGVDHAVLAEREGLRGKERELQIGRLGLVVEMWLASL